ncbi:MAG TPA: hypothetical protein VEQ63_07785, partial [Bryobacteraceae bacterium]|nr:hypothetical protein [Bryobacteraceae bacterium]
MASLINIPVKLFYITQCIPVGKQPFAAPPAAESCRNMDKTMMSTPLKHTPALLLLTMKKVNSIWRQAQ